MSGWAYRFVWRNTVTLATLTLLVALATAGFVGARNVAHLAAAATGDPRSAGATRTVLADLLTHAGVDPATASATATRVVTDPTVTQALQGAAQDGNTGPVVTALTTAALGSQLPPQAQGAIGSVLGLVTGAASGSPTLPAHESVPGLVLPTVGPGAGAFSLPALPRNAWSWASAHTSSLLPVGACASALGVLVCLLWPGRRRSTVRHASRWAVLMGGIPLLVALVVAPAVGAHVSAAPVIVLTTLVRAGLLPSQGLLSALVTTGACGMIAAAVAPRLRWASLGASARRVASAA